MTDGIPSPFMKRAPKEQVTKTLNIEVTEQGKRSNFLDMLSELALVGVGMASILSALAYPTGSLADIVGMIALTAWILAGTKAIVEHSHAQAQKDAKQSIEQIINRAIRKL